MLSLRRKTLPFGGCCCENIHLLSILWYQTRASWCPSFGDVDAQSLVEWHGMCLYLGFQLSDDSRDGPWPCWFWPERKSTIWAVFLAMALVDFEGWTNFKSHKSSLLNWLSREQIVKGVKYFPLVSTPCPMISLTFWLKSSSPFSAQRFPLSHPSIELVSMPSTPCTTHTRSSRAAIYLCYGYSVVFQRCVLDAACIRGTRL